jgi:hypothetical protein
VALLAADKWAEDLANKLRASEEAREKAEKDASCIEDLRKRLHEAETTLSDKITQHVAREGNVASRLESLNRRFVSKFANPTFVLFTGFPPLLLVEDPNFCFSRENESRFCAGKA